MTCMPFRTTRMHPFVVMFDIAIVCTLQNYLHTMSLNSLIRLVVPKSRTPHVLHNHTGHLGAKKVKKILKFSFSSMLFLFLFLFLMNQASYNLVRSAPILIL